MLEFPYFKKPIGYRCNDFKAKDKDLHFQVKNNQIECKTRFSLILNTMQDLRNKSSVYLNALKSRCLVIGHTPSVDDLKKFARDGTFYRFKKITVRPKVSISDKDYEHILQVVEEGLKNAENYLRTVGDCCRAFAVLGKHDDEMYNIIKELHDC